MVATATQPPTGGVELLTAQPMTEAQQQAIEYIMTYDFAAVREKILKKGTLREPIVDEAISEFRKWLILIRLGYGSLAMCSKEVDEVWHTFILFTRSYMSFCQQALGGYLHHEPATNAAPVPGSAKQTFYAAYREVFGPPHALWRIGSSEVRAADQRDPYEPRRAEPDEEPERYDPYHDEPDAEPDDDRSGDEQDMCWLNPEGESGPN